MTDSFDIVINETIENVDILANDSIEEVTIIDSSEVDNVNLTVSEVTENVDLTVSEIVEHVLISITEPAGLPGPKGDKGDTGEPGLPGTNHPNIVELLDGLIDNENLEFSATYPIKQGTELVLINGLVQLHLLHYTVSEDKIIFDDPPETGDILLISYSVLGA